MSASRTEHRFSWWHQGVMLFDRSYSWSDDLTEYTEAASGAWLGQSQSRAVTFVSSGGAVFSSEDAGEAAAEAREYAENDRPDHYLLQLWPLHDPERVVIVRGY